ncbi:unnamed protein product [Closterium sp. NIES-53]
MKHVEQLSHYEQLAATPVHPTKSSALPKRGRGQHSIPVNTADPSGSLLGLHLPTFSTNLVSNAAIQDVWVDTFILGGQRVAIFTCSRTGRHLATSGGCVESGVCVWLACSVLLVSGTLPPDSPLAPPPRSPLPTASPWYALPSPCLWPSQCAAPHSSEFPPTTAPLQTLHKDVWGPAPVGGMDQECYFLLVVDDYTRYTNVFPLRRKAEVSGVLIPWIRATLRTAARAVQSGLPSPASAL